MTKSQIRALVYGSTIFIYLLPFAVWANYLDWEFDSIRPANIFSLLGLWAFMQMWLHYAIGVVKRRYEKVYNLDSWYKSTTNVVLVLILLHPILAFFTARSLGTTVVGYVGSNNAVYVLLGLLALTCFLLYDIARYFQASDFWKRNFEFIKALSIFAMLAIFAHSLQLGMHLQSGLLRIVWLLMLAAFVCFTIDSYTYKKNSN